MIKNKAFREFKTGMGYLKSGYLMMKAQPRMWLYALPTILFYLPVFFLLLAYFPAMLQKGLLLLLIPVTSLWGIWYGKVLIVAGVLFLILPVLFFLVILLVSAISIAAVVGAVFNDLLSIKTEEMLACGHEKTPFSIRGRTRETWIVMKEEIKKILFFLAVQACLLLINVVPVAGHIVYLCLGGTFSVLFLAFEYIDYPMARRLIPLNRKLRMLSAYRWRVAGFGLAVTLVFLVPLFNVFAIAFAVVGATRLYADMQDTDVTGAEIK